MLRDDDLTVRGYALAFQSNRAELTIRSRVRFSDGNTARIRWVATLAGIRIDFDGRIVGQRGTEIELIADGGGYFAWFPDFGLVKGDDAKNAREFKKRMEQLSRLLLSTQEEFSCVVLSSGTTNILFDWKQVAKSSGVPSDRVLRSMIRAHPMTFNDYVGLMTNLRIGKPGYYDIRPADARKRDVGLEEKATKGSGPRFRIVPNND